jgi:hypothetical protein
MASPLTIQPSSKDNIIYEGNVTNYGTLAFFYAMSQATNKDGRGLVEFGITWGTDIPAGATLTGATLYLYYYSYSTGSDPVGRTIEAARVLRTDWVETESAWSVYKADSSWTTAGCGSDGNDYSSNGQASQTVPADFGWMEWDVLTILQDCQTASVNPIFRLKDSAEESATQYLTLWYSREGSPGDTTLRPKLVIEYTEAGGWTNIAKVKGVTATDLAKVRGIAVADIAKRRGVAV